jgi:hypothetical protein
MPHSYFAFLTNPRRVAQGNKIQSVINEFNPSDGEKSKIRSRVGNSSVSGGSISSSLPSVPSLPSISRSGLGGSGSGPGTASGSRPGMSTTASRPGFGGTGPGTNPGTNPGAAALAASFMTDRPIIGTPPRSGVVIYVLVGVLVAAIVVLGYLLVFADK